MAGYINNFSGTVEAEITFFAHMRKWNDSHSIPSAAWVDIYLIKNGIWSKEVVEPSEGEAITAIS